MLAGALTLYSATFMLSFLMIREMAFTDPLKMVKCIQQFHLPAAVRTFYY